MDKMFTQFVIVTIAILHSVHGLYFHIGETERKCFIEEIPDETNVIGKYAILFSTVLITNMHYITKIKFSLWFVLQ